MSLRRDTPCDHGPCPYEAEYNYECEYWCGAHEPQDYPEAWECGVDDEPEDWEKHSGYSYPQSCPPAPEAEPDFWIASTEEIEPAPADETWGWDE